MFQFWNFVRPSQHGEDLIGSLSAIINENSASDSKTSIALLCLALEALQLLGAAQVLDLSSTWDVVRLKLEHHSCAFVLCSLCDFFSVVPSVAVNSPQYEVFKEASLTFLWDKAFHENVVVSHAAFVALSKFHPADFLLKYIPSKMSHSIIELLKSTPKVKHMMEERENDDDKEDIDFGLFPLPGYFYGELLQHIPIDAHPALTEFLKTVVREEIAELPRGLSHKVMKSQEIIENKTMASVPVFLETQHDKCKQPSLKPIIAASLLFCNEIKVERKGGKQMRSQVVNNAKAYRNMLNNLLLEVPVQTSEGQRNMDICLAWTTFMTRVYDVCVEGRRVELAIQKDHGHIDDKELHTSLDNSWLWVRDSLTDQLKTASKGSHIMQGNSLLALAGLVNAVFQYSSNSLEQEEEVAVKSTSSAADDSLHAHYAMPEWVRAVVDTLLVILDGNLKTFGAPMDWCQKVSSVTSTASSLLARSCSALGLSQVIPALLVEEFERLQQICQALRTRIPGQIKAGTSSVMQIHCSLGLGLVLRQLDQGDFSNYSGQEGGLLLAKCLDAFETATFTSDLDNTDATVRALAMSMTSLGRDTSPPVRMHAKATYEQIMKLYERQIIENGALLQASYHAVVVSTIMLLEAEVLDPESTLQTVLDLQRTFEKFSEDGSLASSFGLLVHGLKLIGGVPVDELSTKWEKHWRSLVSDKSFSTNVRVAAVSGLAALYGSEQTVLKLESPNVQNAKSSLEDGVKIFKQLLQSCKDVTLIGELLWYLGRLSLSNKALLSSQSSLPENLDYLGEDSVFNCLTRILVQFGKAGASSSSSTNTDILNTTLRVLAEGPQHPLPPLNWANVLHPLVKHAFGSHTTELCLALALCSSSPTATGTFLSSWLTTSVWMSLDANSTVRVFSSLDHFVRIIPAKKSKEFVENAVKLFSEEKIDMILAEALLDGLCCVLRMSDPPKSAVMFVKEAVRQIYHILPNDFKLEHGAIISKLCVCLNQFSVAETEELTQPRKENLVKSLLVRKQLLTNNKSFSWRLIKPCVDLAFTTGILFDVLPYIVSTISCFTMKDLADIIVEWTMQLLTSLGKSDNPSEMTQATLVILTILPLTSDVMSLSLCLKDSHTFSLDHHNAYTQWLFGLRHYLLETFPNLLAKPEWKFPIEKVIDKLLCLHQSSCNEDLSRVILDVLLQFRNFDVYQKRSIWMQVASCT